MNQAANTRSGHLILPDYCNLGVLFRVLFIVNASVFIALLGRGQGWLANTQEFIETSMLVELICLSSLLSLCFLRQRLASREVPAWAQRAIAGCAPSGICLLVLMYLENMDWFAFSFPRLHTSYAALLCFIYGIGLQHYFELRNRAFSPALGEAKLQALQARIRPHFLFNSLNAVLSLIRTDPRRAESVLEDLADLFRVLMRDTRDMTTLQDEIHLCEQYLSIEKLRLGERLQISWHTENLSNLELSEIKIAALLLQPLLENAVHYGVEPSTKASLILVAIRRNLNKIEISVINPLHADARLSQGNHMALENIRQRLVLLYDIEADLSYGPIGNNFEVKLQFPANK